MPFTLSHPAAVIPLARAPFAPAALIAGSMAPDLLYYLLPGRGSRNFPHSWTGVASVDILFSVVIVAGAHLLRWPAIALAPDRLRRRLAGPARRGFAVRSVREALWWLVSAEVGVITHVVWDGFTHSDGGAVRVLPWLGTLSVAGMPLFAVLQWLSSVVGLLVVAAWLVVWLRRLPATQPPDRLWLSARSRVAVCTGGAALLALGGLVRAHGEWPYGLGAVLPAALFGAGATALVTLGGYGLTWHALDRRQAH